MPTDEQESFRHGLGKWDVPRSVALVAVGENLSHPGEGDNFELRRSIKLRKINNSMEIQSKIKVGNDSELQFNHVGVSTSCMGFVTFEIPLKDGSVMKLDLHRKELREFLARTCPSFSTHENYGCFPSPLK